MPLHRLRHVLFSYLLILASQVVQSSPTKYPPDSKCAPFSGNFTVSAFQLYPENDDFDFNHCVLYIGELWNASLGIYDPYAKTFESIEFPNITHNPEFHIGGVQYDHRTNLLSIVVDAGAAFNTNGQDISGTNLILLWDPATRETLYQLNLTEVTKGEYGAFQDIEHDPDSNVYIVGTFPSSILRVNAETRKVETWYLDDDLNHTISGYGGLAAKDWTLLTNDNATGSLFSFDMRADHGKPALIPVTPAHTFANLDAIYLPRRYNGTVLLVSENGQGASVVRSKDGSWKTAEYLGLVPWPADNGTTTATVQVGDAVYFNIEPFADPGVGGPGTAGNRTDFLYADITSQIDELLKKGSNDTNC